MQSTHYANNTGRTKTCEAQAQVGHHRALVSLGPVIQLPDLHAAFQRMWMLVTLAHCLQL